ncbi:MAG: hypothetical protein KDC54_15360, partial [Lewinella sp.]|nr:hypothetical protein [Lewinella sp.]
GSKRIVGWATRYRLRAEARVARLVDPRPELLRRLVEQNYSLKFSRYALDPDNHITVVFDTDTEDASPYKLYYALKELATQADKQDDLLLEEFGQLEAVDSSHLQPLPGLEAKVKHNFIVNSIRYTLREMEEGPLDPQTYPGGIAYLLLSLIYKIDYLVKPEGYTMEILERIHRRYFTEDKDKTIQQKNQLLVSGLRALLQRSEKDYNREMYRVITTFGITVPATHDRLVHLINGELHHMDWYQENGYYAVAQAIPGYLVGYALFNYALPQPDRDFLHLYYRIAEPEYFRALGFQPDYCEPGTHTLDRRAIRRAIDGIAKKHRAQFPGLRPAVSSLIFDNLVDFSRSYLQMIRQLDLTKME